MTVLGRYLKKSKKNKQFIELNAFTLAEVLITILIIGIVAALTIPTVISYFQEQALITQFKKTYSTLSQAYLMASQEHGTADKWTTQEELYNNLKPYLNVAEDCPKKVGCFPDLGAAGYKSIKGSNSGYIPANVKDKYKLRLADGASIITGAELGRILVDINGDKKPNQWGYDLFFLQLNTKDGSPWLGWQTAYTDRTACSKTLVASNWDGGDCSYWMIRHWNMDYLHKEMTDAEWNN